MSIASRIKARMDEKKLRAVDLVKLTGVSKGTVSQWLNDIAKPRGENLLKLADALACKVDWLLLGKGLRDVDLIPNVEPGPEIKGHYPLISWVQAGAWSAIFEIDVLEAESFPCPVKCSSQTFVLSVQGISMEPVFREGDLIFVDPLAESHHGSYIVARLEDQNEATFKQLIIEQGKKYLKPANPNWPEQIIPITSDCSIVGTVVFAGKIF